MWLGHRLQVPPSRHTYLSSSSSVVHVPGVNDIQSSSSTGQNMSQISRQLSQSQAAWTGSRPPFPGQVWPGVPECRALRCASKGPDYPTAALTPRVLRVESPTWHLVWFWQPCPEEAGWKWVGQDILSRMHPRTLVAPGREYRPWWVREHVVFTSGSENPGHRPDLPSVSKACAQPALRAMGAPVDPMPLCGAPAGTVTREPGGGGW